MNVLLLFWRQRTGADTGDAWRGRASRLSSASLVLTVVCLDVDREALAQERHGESGPGPRAESLAYVI